MAFSGILSHRGCSELANKGCKVPSALGDAIKLAKKSSGAPVLGMKDSWVPGGTFLIWLHYNFWLAETKTIFKKYINVLPGLN